MAISADSGSVAIQGLGSGGFSRRLSASPGGGKRRTKLTTMVAAAMVARAGSPKPEADALVTVFTYNRAGVPWTVMERAKRVATTAFATAGIEVRWVTGKRLGEPQKVAAGEMRTVVFEGPAPAHFAPLALAVTYVGRGSYSDVHIFYKRVAGLGTGFGDRLLPELLGNVLAHELTHALEGVMRHSNEGLMKAVWSGRDYDKMFRGPLPFAAEDLDLLRAHFQKEVWPTLTIVAGR